MMGLRLGYLVPEFPSQTHIFFWREIQALQRLGVEVFLLSTRKPRQSACRHAFAATARAETHYLFPPSVWSIATSATNDYRSLAKSLAYLRGLDNAGLAGRMRRYALLPSAVDLVHWARKMRIDHVHAHSCADAAHLLAMSRRMGGPPYSLTLHGDLDVYGTDHHWKMKDAAFVCAVGKHLYKQLINRVNLPAERILLSFMGLDLSELTSLGEDRSYTPGKLHLVTVARLNPAKGHVHALAAIRAAAQAGLNLHYTIAGEGPFLEAIRARIKALELDEHVTLTGTLSEREVCQLLSEADAFLLPSVGLGEAWPVSMMEAMAAGLPVVASVIGATPEMITPNEDGFLVRQGDEAGIADKITLLARDVETRRRIGEAARKTAERRFDVGLTASALRDAILATAKGGRIAVGHDGVVVQ
jgi:glycosyltransferase involved in cell wall biosynthesis